MSRNDIGFDADHNEVIFMTKSGSEHAIPQASKKDIADQLIKLIDEEIGKG